MNTMTGTTDSIRGVCAELDQRGLAPRLAEIYLQSCDDRDEFVRVARTFAANKVDHSDDVLWASREDGIANITVFAGGLWWKDVPTDDRESVLAGLRREVLAVVADAVSA